MLCLEHVKSHEQNIQYLKNSQNMRRNVSLYDALSLSWYMNLNIFHNP